MRRRMLAGVSPWALLICLFSSDAMALANNGNRRPDPSTVLPMEQVPAGRRNEVFDIIRNHTLHRRAAPDTFPANPRIYLGLLDEPVLTLALWKDLGDSPALLRQTGPNRYTGSDGSGTSATWEFLIKSPRLHALLCDLNYVSPRGAARVSGRIVLIVRSEYLQERGGENWVRHDVEAFVKLDSRAWKALAVTVRPMIESVLEDQVQEAGLFISYMTRIVETYPEWAMGVTRQAAVDPDTRKGFCDLVKQTRRPGAYSGRPVVADRTQESPAARRR